MSACSLCQEYFRVEFCDLRTGLVKDVYTPLAMDWQTVLCGFGQGTLTLATKDVRIGNVWPHLTSVYVTRIAGGLATPRDPLVEFAGMIEQVSASDSGATSVGMVSLESYLNNRRIRDTLNFSDRPQSEIAKALVDYVIDGGIPLRARDGGSSEVRDRLYNDWDRKVVGEALIELSEVIDGVEWELEHAKVNGRWSTTMVFQDEVGADQNMILKSDREANGYGLDVDAKEHANFIDGLGSGEERDQMRSHASDLGIYPRFDDSPTWSDVSIQSTLDDHTRGFLDEHKEPFASPNLTIPGLDPDPRLLRLGDTVGVDVNYGAVTYRGPARIETISWSVKEDGVSRTLEVQPYGRASEAIFNQTPHDECKDC